MHGNSPLCQSPLQVVLVTAVGLNVTPLDPFKLISVSWISRPFMNAQTE
jgi:hypothetical protein